MKHYFLTGLHPGQRFFLPFLRRALNTLRPPTVAILLLNPETRALLRLVPNKVAPRPFFLFACTTRRPRPAPEKALLIGSSTSPANVAHSPFSAPPAVTNSDCRLAGLAMRTGAFGNFIGLATATLVAFIATHRPGRTARIDIVPLLYYRISRNAS